MSKATTDGLTDAAFVALVNRASKAGAAYQAVLREAEAEYARRYGSNPSDWEDDLWIDAIQLNPGGEVTLDKIEEGVRYARESST